MAVDETGRTYEHPLYDFMLKVPGLDVATTSVDKLLTWGLTNSLWIFPMATSCCGIEFMAAAASRVDLDRMGTIIRGTPRQADVMVVAGTITVKMAPRVKRLWDQMPEPKWCVAMGSCAISGDFYRDLYPTVPGIDTVVPVDVYVPGCPPSPEGLMHGMMRLQEKVRAQRAGKFVAPEVRPDSPGAWDPERSAQQLEKTLGLDMETTDARASADAGEAYDAAEALVGRVYEVTTDARTAADVELEPLLRDRFGVTEFPKEAAPLVDASRHLELARTLVDAGFKQLVTIAAVHWPAVEAKGTKAAEPERIEVTYALRSLGKGSKVVSWRVRASADGSVPSLCSVLVGADWHEREQFDMIGVRFAGHPDLRRILLPQSWEGYPLRRDYPSDKACPPWR